MSIVLSFSICGTGIKGKLLHDKFLRFFSVYSIKTFQINLWKYSCFRLFDINRNRFMTARCFCSLLDGLLYPNGCSSCYCFLIKKMFDIALAASQKRCSLKCFISPQLEKTAMRYRTLYRLVPASLQIDSWQLLIWWTTGTCLRPAIFQICTYTKPGFWWFRSKLLSAAALIFNLLSV